MSHGPCKACGSSDAFFTYPDSHGHCFSCGAHTPASGRATAPKPAATGLLEVSVEGFGVRGINDATAQHFGTGYSELHGERAQVYPYCDERGRVVAQKVRTRGKKFTIVGNAAKMRLFGQHLWRNGGRSLVITEGEVDALSVSQAQGHRFPVVSVPNGAQGAAEAVRRSLEWVEGFEKVVLFFDADEVGRAAAEQVAALLSPGRAFIAHYPEGFKDANDLTKANRSADIVKAFWEAKQWRPDELVGAGDVWQRLLKMDRTMGLPLPHAGLTDALMGLRPGEVTAVVAGTGQGKSTFCREAAAALALAGHKVGYVGLEEGVERSLLGLLSVAVSRPLHLDPNPDLSTADVAAAQAKFAESVVFYDAFGSLDPDVLISKMRFMAKGEGCRVVFLDHLSIVTSGGELALDERRTIDRMMTRLVSLVNETKVHVVAVAHLSRREGTTHEEGRVVTLADLRGSHGISQLCANVVAIERDQQGDERDVSTVRVLKCRHTGRTGVCGELQYDVATGRQTERAGALASAATSPFADDLA